MVKRYLRYCTKAKGKYSIHSPFVYELLTSTIQRKGKEEELIPLENLIKDLKSSSATISVQDKGAGSRTSMGAKRKIGDIAKRSGTDKKFGRLLFRLAKDLECQSAIELGTSLGISTMYLAQAVQGEVQTIEGCPNTLNIAKRNFAELEFQNIRTWEGDLHETLPIVLEKEPSPDLVFIDGDHRFEQTLSLVREALDHAHNNTLIVLDDIHWSEGMEKAWEEIKRMENVRLTIDLFRMGLIFLRKEQLEKQNFVLRFF